MEARPTPRADATSAAALIDRQAAIVKRGVTPATMWAWTRLWQRAGFREATVELRAIDLASETGTGERAAQTALHTLAYAGLVQSRTEVVGRGVITTLFVLDPLEQCPIRRHEGDPQRELFEREPAPSPEKPHTGARPFAVVSDAPDLLALNNQILRQQAQERERLARGSPPPIAAAVDVVARHVQERSQERKYKNVLNVLVCGFGENERRQRFEAELDRLADSFGPSKSADPKQRRQDQALLLTLALESPAMDGLLSEETYTKILLAVQGDLPAPFALAAKMLGEFLATCPEPAKARGLWNGQRGRGQVHRFPQIHALLRPLDLAWNDGFKPTRRPPIRGP